MGTCVYDATDDGVLEEIVNGPEGSDEAGVGESSSCTPWSCPLRVLARGASCDEDMRGVDCCAQAREAAPESRRSVLECMMSMCGCM